MQQRMTILTLGVSDLDKSNHFYEKILGWTKTPSSNDNISFFLLNAGGGDGGGILFSLFPRHKLLEDVAGASPPTASSSSSSSATGLAATAANAAAVAAIPSSTSSSPTALSSFPGFTVAYNCCSHEEVDRVFSNLRAKHVTVVKDPQSVFWGGYSGYIADPDGHLWEIAYNPFLKLDDDGNLAKEQGE